MVLRKSVEEGLIISHWFDVKEPQTIFIFIYFFNPNSNVCSKFPCLGSQSLFLLPKLKDRNEKLIKKYN
jgi:hypothetical protein